MKITFISDTHGLHKQVNLPGGDMLIHSGDMTGRGYMYETIHFMDWLEDQDYTHKILVAGNHDSFFQDNRRQALEVIIQYGNICYLEDNLEIIGENYQDSIKVYGSPWQPEFRNWAFNLPRHGDELKEKWDMIPVDTDILVTHGPPQDHLDVSGPPWNEPHLGCELLRLRVDEIKPKIHVFGHIHGSYGYKFHEGTHFINAAVLNERYEPVNKPLTVEWNKDTNELEFI